MDFQIWKVEHLAGDNRSWFTYSIRQGQGIPLILYEDQFKTLFPNIDLELIPKAPNTTTIEITAAIK